ncbi:MAG: 3-deoxy-7-phosphoheptulonate synthase [Cyclobacteriaceae bacterium]|nr:3-deoxy-7-phosphoheptulonate synthase [Cyclobacteriaceae bacterium]MCB0500770.1 3-deoxy-7-phosphoheptulonate synthase [Cyclobacteriaceae bacterium]MCB9236695.1 3-deoxy-7-phosphoheptulonate synthase [Flammeovirgaceae bacterium]MCO5272616.1 3-deoxy-7-phosphoheptulonate synthase [Cyclobacteriaceae bacterium]MCW5901974.1 3-deoxy-7-phosphoheptulonate synthase [Cyclobacteriaceae bacterium]
MIIQLEGSATAEEKEKINRAVAALGYKTTAVKTQVAEYVIGIGKKDFDIRQVGSLPGIADIHRVSDDYKLVSRKWKVNRTVIGLGDGVEIGNGALSLMAGPCSIESEAQMEATIAHLVANKVSVMRGGVFKPRSSPYSFRGLGAEGLKVWASLARAAGIKIISEVMQVSQVREMYDYVDIFQVGARNTQNFNLLDELGRVDKPVMIKRGISGTLDELLSSAEYVFSGGNEKLILCERGIRTYERASRNTMDVNAIPILKEKTHLPVIADPSHGVGLREYVEPVALACIMAGADGIIYETHKEPEKAFSDGRQTLDFSESQRLVERARKVFELRENLR